MWVRGIAAALAAWCVSGVALAANYSEVWNPPEAAGHVRKPSGGGKVGNKATTHAGVKAAAKPDGRRHATVSTRPAGTTAAKSGGVQHRASNVHPVHPAHPAPRVAAAPGAGKTGRHDQVKKVVGKGGAAVNPHAVKTRAKAPLMVQGSQSHFRYAQAASTRGKPMSASVASGHATRSQPVSVTAKNNAPAAAQTRAPVATTASGNPAARSGAANPVMADTNPATASSGSMPPILH
jgi:hypothetical protein